MNYSDDLPAERLYCHELGCAEGIRDFTRLYRAFLLLAQFALSLGGVA